MAYYRVDDATRILVVANFGEASVELELEYPVKEVLLSNSLEPKGAPKAGDTKVSFAGCEAFVLLCE